VLTLDDVRAAAALLDGIANRTPVMTSRTLDRMLGARVHLKAEQFQRMGAFKFRGAYHAIARLDDETRARGVCTVSSGNHAQAVALAASLLGTRSTILMPRDAPIVKLEATRGYGGEVVFFDREREDRDEAGRRLAAERGLTLVHPYDDEHVMAGQGTVALELLEEVGDLDLLVVAIGGGGLIAGCATAAKGIDPEIRVVGVEPAGGDATRRSIEAGERVRLDEAHTIADGLRAVTPGALTLPINRRLLDEVVTVDDGEIIEAMRLLFDRLKLVTEPSGAAALAALLAGRADVAGRRVGVVLSGGNVGVERFCALLAGAGPDG
jgi:threo-3-hydroxy-L-aspartate ammonia-lyase